MTTRNDIEDMIARISLRDRDAFAALYDATSAKLFGVCLGVLRNRSEAEEVLQEVFLRVWHKSDTYIVTGHSPMTWLITIARNKSIDRLRMRKRSGGSIDDVADLADDRPGPEDSAIARSENARIETCLKELDLSHAQAVRSAYMQGATYKEIAAVLDVPINTVRTWLRRSLMTLRACLTR